MRTAPPSTPPDRQPPTPTHLPPPPPPPLPPVHRQRQARAASRQSRASEPLSCGRCLSGPGRGHHLDSGLRAYTSSRLASAADLEMFLQIWAPPAFTDLASV
ncbi:acrosin-like [Ovis canadensis]|uniref:acrosin-like n=1 Tax=Ovis canadensis TaxID=37174 RepID=UPI0038B5618F